MSEDDLVLRGERVELIRGGSERLAGELRDLRGDESIKALRSVKPCSDRGSAESELGQRGDRELQQLDVSLKARPPAGNLLAELYRGSVLKMSTTRLDDVVILLLKALKGGDELLDCRDQLVLNRDDSRNVHSGRESIVRRLAHIDVVVRVSQLPAGDLVSARADDLVRVHIRLRAGAGLPYNKREMIIELPRDDLIAGSRNCGELLRWSSSPASARGSP